MPRRYSSSIQPQGFVNTRVRHVVLLLLAACVLAVPATAQASYKQVIQDCAEDGVLDHHYPTKDLVKAKKHLPSDLDEYSDCREVIGAAIGGPGRPHKGGGGGGGIPPAKAAAAQDHKALAQATGRDKPKVRIGNRKVEPGSNGLFNLSGSNGLPLPLLLSLIAVGILATGGGLYALRRRIPALANIRLPRLSLSRVPFPRLRR
jgi:hypothetical protein